MRTFFSDFSARFVGRTWLLRKSSKW